MVHYFDQQSFLDMQEGYDLEPCVWHFHFVKIQYLIPEAELNVIIKHQTAASRQPLRCSDASY